MLHIYLLRISNGFAEMADAKLVERALDIHQKVSTKTSIFVTPTPTMTVVLEAIQNFQSAMQAASDGSREAAAQKNQLKLELVSVLHNLGTYVLFVSQGDRLVALASGFTIAKEPTPVQLTKPTPPVLTPGVQSGWMQVSIKRQRGIRSYQYQYTTDADLKEDSWVTTSCTSSKCMLKGLTPGRTYFVRVSIVGPKDQLFTSDVISRVAA